jgi:hypothetical protein
VAGIAVLAAAAVALVLLFGNNDDDPTITAGGSTATTGTGSSTTEDGSSDAGTSSSTASSTGAEEIPPATVTPDGLGDDPLFDQLAQECHDGHMRSCDDLYEQTKNDESYAAYTEYADTCAGRQASGTRQFCSNVFPGD